MKLTYAVDLEVEFPVYGRPHEPEHLALSPGTGVYFLAVSGRGGNDFSAVKFKGMR